MSAPLIELAPAKLNLSLEVTGRRIDGYHELATLFQTVEPCDTLELWPAEGIELECDRSAPAGEANLVVRAARLLAAECGIDRGAQMRLVKRIPVAAGLGGGSSDAAAALRGLCRLWGLTLPYERLLVLGRRLGADVPFLLRGGTALAVGIGDEITWLPEAPTQWALLLTPEATHGDKTARAFQVLPRAAWSDGARTRRLAEGSLGTSDLSDAPNAFESVADALYPSVPSARARMLAAGAPWTRLTGAGPTLFTLFEDEAMAREVAARLADAGARVGATRGVLTESSAAR